MVSLTIKYPLFWRLTFTIGFCYKYLEDVKLFFCVAGRAVFHWVDYTTPTSLDKKVTFSHFFYNTFLSCQMAIYIRKSQGDSVLLKKIQMSFESKLLFLLPLWISLNVEDPCSSVSVELWRCLGENPPWRVYLFRVNAEESKFQCNVEVCNPVLQKRCEILLIFKDQASWKGSVSS